MPKFYAECGEYRIVSSQESPLHAALDLIRQADEPGRLSPVVTISQTGFDSEEDTNVWFDTQAVAEAVAHG